jgi:hypothetical protein
MSVIPMRPCSPPPNDPLAGKTKKQLFVDCVWMVIFARVADGDGLSKLYTRGIDFLAWWSLL